MDDHFRRTRTAFERRVQHDKWLEEHGGKRHRVVVVGGGFGRRLLTFVGWLRSFIGSTRPERVFSVGHTGGDLSAPDSVLSAIMPFRFPAAVPADRGGKDDEQPNDAG